MRGVIATDFFDYPAVKEVWYTFKTRAAMEREHAKSWGPYETWVKTFFSKFEAEKARQKQLLHNDIKAWKKLPRPNIRRHESPYRHFATELLKDDPNAAAIKTAYDIQLAYEHWYRYVFRQWWQRFEISSGRWYTFDDVLKARQSFDSRNLDRLPTSSSNAFLPDWRDAEDKAVEKKIYARYAANHADWRHREGLK